MLNKTYDIYIILTQTGTIVSRIIKLFTKKPYNHVSLADDETLTKMYSFCRFRQNMPLPAGFKIETAHKGIFEDTDFIPCEIYKITVDSEQYREYKKAIRFFRIHTKLFSYNIIGLALIFLGIPFRRRTRFVCSQFVAYILNSCKITSFDKDISLITPDDFRYLDNAELVYHGSIKNFLLKTVVT